MLTAVKSPAVPFDTKARRLMDEAGIDVLLATSKHNVQYLLGGHRAFFFDYMDAMGISRYLPVVVYPKGAPDKAAFIGHGMESYQHQVHPFWTPGGADAGVRLGRRHAEGGRARAQVRRARPSGSASRWRSCRPMPARRCSRACRTARSSTRCSCWSVAGSQDAGGARDAAQVASERVIESMQAVIAKHGPGTTKQELADALKREEVNRGLTFEYCLIAAGSSLNRAPSEQRWAKGDVLSLDSGGNYHGYIGDLAAWPSWASLMPSSRNCWARSRRSSAPP